MISFSLCFFMFVAIWNSESELENVFRTFNIHIIETVNNSYRIELKMIKFIKCAHHICLAIVHFLIWLSNMNYTVISMEYVNCICFSCLFVHTTKSTILHTVNGDPSFPVSPNSICLALHNFLPVNCVRFRSK